MKRLLALAAVGYGLAAASVFSHPATLSAYADGAPPGFSGGAGEQGCDACHFEFDINMQPGALTIAGVPERYAPGERYTLTVTLARAGMKLAGFQLAARFEDGKQAGAFAPAGGEAERVKVETHSGIEYANQRRAGAMPVRDIARWTLVWTAPAGGAVTFHASANAANGDEAAQGDYVYAAAVRSGPR